LPATGPLRVGAKNVIVGQYMREAERFGRLCVIANSSGIITKFSLREYDAYFHYYFSK
jgi:hypothetical protein